MSALGSTFSGRAIAFRAARPAPAAAAAPRAAAVRVEAKKVCDLTGKKRNKANSVTFSNKHSRKWQEPNLQHKKVFWEQGQRWVKLRVCTKAIKTIEKNGLDAMAKEAGIDLWKLPFEDARPERRAYLEQNKGKVPVVSSRLLGVAAASIAPVFSGQLLLCLAPSPRRRRMLRVDGSPPSFPPLRRRRLQRRAR